MFLEQLEERKLKSVTLNPVNDMIEIQGTAANDEYAIVVDVAPNNVSMLRVTEKVSGSQTENHYAFTLSKVAGITADLGDGSDSFDMQDVPLPAFVNGGLKGAICEI